MSKRELTSSILRLLTVNATSLGIVLSQNLTKEEVQIRCNGVILCCYLLADACNVAKVNHLHKILVKQAIKLCIKEGCT